MQELPAEILEPFDGYLDLGMFEEAHQELENLPSSLKQHPSVRSAQLDLLMEMGRWKDAVSLGRELSKLWPEECEFYIRTAFCLHELKRTAEARQTLLDGPASLRAQAVFFYNLACYEAQLGNLAEANQQLITCFSIDKRYKAESLDDPDLKPLWRSSQKSSTSPG